MLCGYKSILAHTFVRLQYVIYPGETVLLDLAHISEQEMCMKLQTHWDISTIHPADQDRGEAT